MHKKHNLLRLVAALTTLAVVGGAASAAIYTWSDAGDGHDFTEPENWCNEDPCGVTYPDDSNDDALFPVKAVGGRWEDVILDWQDDIEIDDMTILDGVDFVAGEGVVLRLIMDSLFVDAANAAITITFTEKMVVIANPPPGP
jgi:hypothetical protein